MSVLISGGTGFVGLNLAEALLRRGEHVVVVALDALPGRALARFATLPGRLDTAVADVTDTEGFTALLRRHAVDRLFPFAAITSGPAREAEAPERIVEVNLLGLIGQLRAARDAGMRRVVVPSSAAVYGESVHTHALIGEETPCVPATLYGVTKYAVERGALRLGALWGVDVVAARIGALFGPWERDTGLRDTLSPFFHVARLALAGREAVLPAILPPYGFVYAPDVAEGLLHLLDLPDPPHRVFNVGSPLDWAPALADWCAVLAERPADVPGFHWRRSDDPASVTVPLADMRSRGLTDVRRIAATGWSPRFPPGPALADYRAWLLEGRLTTPAAAT